MKSNHLKIGSKKIQRVCISRTDAIGDVILTLPLAKYLADNYPETKVDFLAAPYTMDIISRANYLDQKVAKTKANEYFESFKPDAIIMVFPDKEISELAKKQKIKFRVGTSHRWWHWLHLNKRVDFSRKNSELHEAQLNFKLLAPFGIDIVPELGSIRNYLGPSKEYDSKQKIQLIFHPKSKGSARDWPLENYKKTAELLDKERFEINITGTEKERDLILEEMPDFFSSNRMLDKTGQFSLSELVDFIDQSDGLLACSTGPLHIAAALNKFSLGLYPPLKPMHPGRWAPLGENAYTITGKESCLGCKDVKNCDCMNSISADIVAKSVTSHFDKSVSKE